MKDWKKKLASSLRSMELGFSGSQARWLEVFIETLLAKQKKEIIEKIKEHEFTAEPSIVTRHFKLTNEDLRFLR